MKTIPMFDNRYLEAHAAASAMLKSGAILAFCCAYNREQGRVITIETDQGWDPDPFYCDRDWLPGWDFEGSAA